MPGGWSVPAASGLDVRVRAVLRSSRSSNSVTEM